MGLAYTDDFSTERQLIMNTKNDKKNQNTQSKPATQALSDPAGSDYAVFTYVEQSLGEPLLNQVTYWLPLDRALSYAEKNGGFVLSRFIPQNTEPSR